MPRGGKRNGAGRKRGGLAKKTTEIAQREIEKGVSPLEVLLHVMRLRYEEEDWAAAVAAAVAAAPFIHPRLSSMNVKADVKERADLLLEVVVVDANGSPPARTDAPGATGVPPV